MAKKSFIKGAAILGAAGIIIKILGAFFRIPLSNLIGGILSNGISDLCFIFDDFNSRHTDCNFSHGFGKNSSWKLRASA